MGLRSIACTIIRDPNMTVTLNSRADFTLETYKRVAWGGAPVQIAPAAGEKSDRPKRATATIPATLASAKGSRAAPSVMVSSVR